MRTRTIAILVSMLSILVSCKPAVSVGPPTSPVKERATATPTPTNGEQSSTTKGGLLQSDDTWSGEILVEEPVIVPEGVTLTIAPGTVVKFRHYRGYKGGKVGLLVEGGTIKAVGTSDRQIWFTSDADDPINGDWGGISLIKTTTGLFDYVIVEYAEIGIEQFYSQANVSNSIIRWNNSEGLYAENSQATFARNTIYGNAYHAIALENLNQIDIINNLIIGDGHQTVHLERSNALIEGNYFRRFAATGERAISLMCGSHAVVRKNKFDLHGGREAFAVDADCTLEAEDNDFGDGHISPPQFDYRDIKKSELGYLPGDPQDRYMYVFDPIDETREVVARYGEGLGLGWSLAYADGGVWRFAGGGVLVKLVPGRGIDYGNEYAVPDQIAARGLTYDGEYFWAHDHINFRIVKFKLGDQDVESGKAIEVVATFDAPEKELGGGAGIATDGEYLYIPSIAKPDKLYKLDKEGRVIGEIEFEGPIGPAIAWDGEHFWSGGGNVIFEWSKDGRRIGMIYGPAVEVWDLTWGDGYLWTINRTCENWNDAKVFQIKVLNVGSGEAQEPTPPREDQVPPPQTTQPQKEAAVSGPRELTVTIDGDRVGAPISKYIYGAFIEHQGRCIYGGIWAEMLQDRKFLYPVNYYFPWGEQKNKSPWRAIPFDTVVVMDDVAPYVGGWTPRIELTGKKDRGIAQGGLGLRRGHDYTGYVIAAADGDITLAVSLVWGAGADDRQEVTLGKLGSEYARLAFRFTAGADTDDGRLEITGRGRGMLHIGTASLMPADNVEGMRADTLALLQELDFTVYRWPGGIFVNDYRWREAVGDRDRRPPRLNNAYWSEDVESNDFGLDEFLTLCRLVEAEPYIVVSATGPNDDDMAAQEVEYVNGSPDTPMGKLRATNGHPEPYNVKFWGVGNEMWAVPLDRYVEQHNRIAQAMLAVDPTIQIIAVGGVEFPGLNGRERSWARDMLAHCADNMSLISEHIYGGSSPHLIEHANSIAVGVREVTQYHRRYHRELDLDTRLALDEWNYSWENRAEIYGEAGPRYYLRDALGIAIGLHEVVRNSDLIAMVNIHPVNVHGQVKTTKTDAAMEATALAFKLYRHHFGTLPLHVGGDYAPLDIAAAWSKDRRTLSIAIVNPTLYKHVVNFALENARLSGRGQGWLITGPDPMAYNEPGIAPQVTVSTPALNDPVTRLNVPPLSIVIYQFDASS